MPLQLQQQPNVLVTSWSLAAALPQGVQPSVDIQTRQRQRFHVGKRTAIGGSFYRQRQFLSAKIRRPSEAVDRHHHYSRSSALEEIEGQGQMYLLAIEGTIVHWRSYRSIPSITGSFCSSLLLSLLIKLTRSHRWPCPWGEANWRRPLMHFWRWRKRWFPLEVVPIKRPSLNASNCGPSPSNYEQKSTYLTKKKGGKFSR